ncbi:MAG: LptF/LptG family permease, partial [Porphyromonas sp.]|nr:LptF/LptG family permease [Porphyromonas sp.]
GYILFMTVTSTFAISGEMEPWLAAWLPNFVFVVIALSLWRQAPQ